MSKTIKTAEELITPENCDSISHIIQDTQNSTFKQGANWKVIYKFCKQNGMHVSDAFDITDSSSPSHIQQVVSFVNGLLQSTAELKATVERKEREIENLKQENELQSQVIQKTYAYDDNRSMSNGVALEKAVAALDNFRKEKKA